MKPVTLGNRILETPILQGGMGVGVSLGGLAGAVAKEGGMGVISAAHPGYQLPLFETNYRAANCQGLIQEIGKAKENAQGHGLVGVNLMVAMNHYDELVRAAIEGGVDAIISGAGLPLELPGLVGDADVLLAPIVSSGKAARLICQSWQRHHGRLPDFIVIEGCEAGGHLGFKPQELEDGTAQTLEQIIPQVLEAVAAFATPERPIPVFAGGGVYSGQDIRRMVELGCAGVQIGTRFIATWECDACTAYKTAMLECRKEDILLVKSPVGMPGRALRSPLMVRQQGGSEPRDWKCIGCIRPCDPQTTPYCITKALIAAVKGDWENGLFFCGSNAWRLDRMLSVRELMELLRREYTEE